MTGVVYGAAVLGVSPTIGFSVPHTPHMCCSPCITPQTAFAYPTRLRSRVSKKYPPPQRGAWSLGLIIAQITYINMLRFGLQNK